MVGAGNEFLQAADLLGIHALRLLKHLVGIAVCLLGDVFKKGGQHTFFLRKVYDLASWFAVLPVIGVGCILLN